MKAHVAAVTAKQLRALDQLGPVLSPQGFYLVGGTALALQLGHRKSVDLDWFVAQGLDAPLMLAESLRAQGVALEVASIDAGTLHGTVANVRVSFLRYGYPLLDPLVQWEEHHCVLASVRDIACMKLAAIGQRGAKKDFIDMYALLTSSSTTLPRLFEDTRRKYRLKDVGHMLHALTYFVDADAEPMPKMIWRATWPEVKSVIKNAVQEFARGEGLSN
jgi:hypothetical protein